MPPMINTENIVKFRKDLANEKAGNYFIKTIIDLACINFDKTNIEAKHSDIIQYYFKNFLFLYDFVTYYNDHIVYFTDKFSIKGPNLFMFFNRSLFKTVYCKKFSIKDTFGRMEYTAHNINKPAKTFYGPSIDDKIDDKICDLYFINGLKHRINGPACIEYFGKRNSYYYLNGKEYHYNAYWQIMDKRAQEIQ